METFYNYGTFTLFISGIFSVILTVSLIYGKQWLKRNQKRDELQEIKRIQPETIGDIEAKLNETYGFQPLSITILLTQWGLQPLLIIALMDAASSPGLLGIAIIFSLIIFNIIHELGSSASHSDKTIYQLTVLFVWIISFALISYQTNIKREIQSKNHAPKSKQTTQLSYRSNKLQHI